MKATVARLRARPSLQYQNKEIARLRRAAPPGLKNRIVNALQSGPTAIDAVSGGQKPPPSRVMKGPFSKRGPGQDARGQYYYDPRYDKEWDFYPGPRLMGKRPGGRSVT